VQARGDMCINCEPSELYRVQTTMPQAMASSGWDRRKWDGFRQEIDAVLLAPSSTLRKLGMMKQLVLVSVMLLVGVTAWFLFSGPAPLVTVGSGCNPNNLACAIPPPSPPPTCSYKCDGECDDGGPGSAYNSCPPGTDDQDCTGIVGPPGSCGEVAEEGVSQVGSSVGYLPFLFLLLVFASVIFLCWSCSHSRSVKVNLAASLRAALEAISAREQGISFHLREENQLSYGSKGRVDIVVTYFIEAQWGGALPAATGLMGGLGGALAAAFLPAASHLRGGNVSTMGGASSSYTGAATGAVVPAPPPSYSTATALACSSSAVPMGIVVAGTAVPVQGGSAQERMQELQELHKSGTITQQEYDNKRGQLLTLL